MCAENQVKDEYGYIILTVFSSKVLSKIQQL